MSELESNTKNNIVVNVNTEQTKERKRNLPIRKYLVETINKIIVSGIIVALFILIDFYSNKINPPATGVDNPTNIIGIFDSEHIILIILSFLLFLLVLGSFAKTILFDHREEFGIVKLKSKKSFFLFTLIISFIGAIYVLLDVALQNIYLTLGPIDFVWLLSNFLHSTNIQFFSSWNVPLTNRYEYARIRSYFFFGFYLYILIFPVVMFLILLTRLGRRRIFPKRKDHTYTYKKGFFSIPMLIFLPIFIIPFLLVAALPFLLIYIRIVFLICGLLLLLIWIFQFIKFLIKGVEISALFGFANILMIVPIIFLFYVFPALLWSFYDFFTNLSSQKLQLDPVINSFSTYFINNLVNVIRIFELDFIFILSVSAIAIGFAEGYSILSILQSIFSGVNVENTGPSASENSPKIIVQISKTVMAGAWLLFLWDRLAITISSLKSFLIIFFPFFKNVNLPSVFNYFKNVNFTVTVPIIDYIFAITILIIPVYYILMSSFKFLSVTLIVNKTKNDQQMLFLLSASAFVLIITSILNDIIANITLAGENSYLPMAIIPTGNVNGIISFLIIFSNQMIEVLESLFFYIGSFIAFIFLVKSFINRSKSKSKTKPITEQESVSTNVTS